MNRWISITTLALVCALCAAASGVTVRDVCRIEGQGESILQGLGLVTGLRGTGDSGEDLIVARPLARVLENNGLPVGSLEELGNSKSVALVLVSCVIPREGARVDDRFDITVTVLNSASSLEGGRLYLSPLTGPYPGSPVFAIAEGDVQLESLRTPTRGKVRRGARLRQSILPPDIRGEFNLIIEPRYAGQQTARHVAQRIEDEYRLSPEGAFDRESRPIAEAVDDRTVRVRVPDDLADSIAGFIADVMTTEVDPAQMRLPARVMVSRSAGSIVVTGDVEISLVAISHRNLVIRRVEPPPVPNEMNPLITNERVVGIGTRARASERAKLDDLLEAFKALDVPVEDQITIVEMLHKVGRLHADLVAD